MVSHGMILALISYLVFQETGNLLIAGLAGLGVVVIAIYLDCFFEEGRK